MMAKYLFLALWTGKFFEEFPDVNKLFYLLRTQCFAFDIGSLSAENSFWYKQIFIYFDDLMSIYSYLFCRSICIRGPLWFSIAYKAAFM